MKEFTKIPEISVGIMSSEEITFTLNGIFYSLDGKNNFSGKWTTSISGSRIILKNDLENIEFADSVLIIPRETDSASFIIHSVTIGVDFHWQRKEDQVFKGNLKLLIENGKITVINILSIEDYLLSVISSEMKATASKEFLKAHAVISRSWLLAQLEKNKFTEQVKFKSNVVTDDEIVRWYDREDHSAFNVCADDHCQRYQGITRASTHIVEEVIKETSGEVLTWNGVICDTRYYKCCGGVTELFEDVWEPVNHPYLTKVVDNNQNPASFGLNLDNDLTAGRWIKGRPDAFCNTTDRNVLVQVLNDYDLETNDFFRWIVTYTQKELGDMVRLRTGIDFGTITDLIPLERGASGRIKRLKIVGTVRTMIIGKELEIRKALSSTHLYSSCFITEKAGSGENITFSLHGAGWGHGVGLCQIGAAVMGSKGYTYGEILSHYFQGAHLQKKY